MKFRFIIIAVFLCAIVLIITATLFFKSRLFCDDKYQRKFVIDSGFLSYPDNTTRTINNYIKALQILQSQGIDRKYLDGKSENDRMEEHLVIDFNEIAALVVEGAKSEELGITSSESNSGRISLPNYREVKFADFIALPIVISQVVIADLGQKKNLDRALLLGKANIAMGVQFSAYNSRLIHAVGLLCKREGLKILEAYVKVCSDQNLLKSISDMRTEFEKECENVKEKR